MDFDITRPFESAGSGSKKRAFLVAGENKAPRTVRRLYKLALYRGKSISIYDLIGKTYQHISRPSQNVIDQIIQTGHEIANPAIPQDDVDAWIEHGKSEAKRLGLTIDR